jgi:hypothetical protein
MSEGSILSKDISQNYLLVEGNDDEHVFSHLLLYHQLPDAFKIKNTGSIEKLLKSLQAELKGSRPRIIGIVVDADTDIEARWQALHNILVQSGYQNVPALPYPDGTILEQEDLPTVGTWLMPDNTIPGMLEDFIRFLVPTGDTLWPLAEDVVQQVIEKDRRFSLAIKSKAHIHTWLAWQKEPGRPLGMAISAHYLDATAPQAIQLMNWIQRLFNIS